MNLPSSLLVGPAALLTAIALASPAAATGCHDDPYTLKFPCAHPDTGQLTDCYYVHDECDPLGGGCLFSEWIYVEDNGLAELQRCDEVHADNCFPQCVFGGDRVIF